MATPATPDITRCRLSGKLPYPDVASALTAAEQVADLYGSIQYPYSGCRCRNWHLTSLPPSAEWLTRMASTDDGTAVLLELNRIHATATGLRLLRHRREDGRKHRKSGGGEWDTRHHEQSA